MRVITGSAGRIELTAPRHPGLRPTQDKVRQAIFSSLGDAVPGARAADLFAGTGALGIEALSRGALHAVFVESNRPCLAAIRANLERTRLTHAATVVNDDAVRFAERSPAAFDLVFADPPYLKHPPPGAAEAEARLLETLLRCLKPGGTLIYEFYSPRPPALHGDPPARLKRYGETGVLFLGPRGAGSGP